MDGLEFREFRVYFYGVRMQEWLRLPYTLRSVLEYCPLQSL